MRSIQTLEDLREAWPLITGSEAPAHGTPVFAEPQGCVAWAQQAPVHITPLEQEAQQPATTHQTGFQAQQQRNQEMQLLKLAQEVLLSCSTKAQGGKKDAKHQVLDLGLG